MQDRIEALAEFSVARGCGFAMLAIMVAMVGCSFDGVLALKMGATLTLITALTLMLRAAYAERKPYKSTEVWILLRPDDRPPSAYAQRVIAAAMKRAYFRFALYFASGATALLLLALTLSALRP